MRRYFIDLAYDGTRYHGWQIQPNGDTIQQQLTSALTTYLRIPTTVTGAGRTDTGVHASFMVAHFDHPAEKELDLHLLRDKLNRLLPADISIYRIREVRPDAHARFDALYRKYQYHIATVKYPFERQYHYQLYSEPDFSLMNKAAGKLFNYTDFTSFSKLHTDVKTNNCRIMHAQWTPAGDNRWVFTIQADRFLRNMVRAIVGTLLEVGRKKISIEEFCRIIELKDRCKAGSSVPGNALFLTDIGYPEELFLH